MLPGVGAYSTAMKLLNELNFIEPLEKANKRKASLMGICLGMQLFFDESEEFKITKGLGFIPGKITALKKVIQSNMEKIPHTGWSNLLLPSSRKNWKGTVINHISSKESVYFTHSYVAETNDVNVLAYFHYGKKKLVAAVQKDNIIGCQFHPEKSGDVGLKILSNFLKSLATYKSD